MFRRITGQFPEKILLLTLFTFTLDIIPRYEVERCSISKQLTSVFIKVNFRNAIVIRYLELSLDNAYKNREPVLYLGVFICPLCYVNNCSTCHENIAIKENPFTHYFLF